MRLTVPAVRETLPRCAAIMTNSAGPSRRYRCSDWHSFLSLPLSEEEILFAVGAVATISRAREVYLRIRVQLKEGGLLNLTL